MELFFLQTRTVEEKPTKSGAVTPTPTSAAAAQAAAAASATHLGSNDKAPSGGVTPKRRDSSAPSDTTLQDVPTVVVNGKDSVDGVKMSLSSAVAAAAASVRQNVRSGGGGAVDLDYGPPSEHVENYKTIQQILTR